MDTPTIRRRTNGTIDLDFYRERALMERAAVRRNSFRRAGGLVRPAVAIAALLAAVAVVPGPNGRPAANSSGSMQMAAIPH